MRSPPHLVVAFALPEVILLDLAAPGLDLCLHVVRRDLGAAFAAALARRAHMSPRTFARRFRHETGTTPAQWLLEQRTRAAQALLETTDLSIEAVAAQSGFGSAATMRTQFARRLVTTPTSYRRSFRGVQV